MSGNVFGIDLGTTYSAVAVIDENDQPTVIKNQSSEDTTPSVVYFDNGVAIVGTEAKSSLVADPDNGVALIKRHMGAVHPLDFAGQSYTPESISAVILKELVQAANQENDSKFTKAVITVPAYFGVKEKESTRQAADMAGLQVLGIIAEPIAAALSEGVKGERRETVLVYDLGGGTFDTTVMIAEPGNLEVVAVDGNRLLGGADWDQALAKIVIDRFVAQSGLSEDPGQDPDFMIELLNKVEENKKALTKKQEVSFTCRYEDAKERVVVTRDEFEAATAVLVQQTVDITNRVIATAQAKSQGLTIDKLLLVGGSSRMPMVHEALRAAGFDPIPSQYDLAVAKGAAIYGEALDIGAVPFPASASGESSGTPALDGSTADVVPNATARPFLSGETALNIKNVLSRGIGVEFVRETTSGDLEPYVGFMVHANDPLPIVDNKLEAGTAADNQTSVRVKFYEQGGEVEAEDLGSNVILKEAEISELPSLPRGSLIELLLSVSNEGMATLSAREPISGQVLKLEAKISALSEEQVEAGRQQVDAIMTRS